ncbi:hypothetical protein B7463_g10541, partial [Scytalidium lignicola]
MYSATMSTSLPRVIIIGAGSRGNAYSRAIHKSGDGIIAAVAEPHKFKRQLFGKTYIWGKEKPEEGQEFDGWKEFIEWELQRREMAANGEAVPLGVDGVFVCTLDNQHKEIIIALAPLKLHIMSEKPLATTLDDCISIYASLLHAKGDPSLFTIGHVLRYSPFNTTLRKLVVDDRAIGEVMSMEHTEPVGWEHFSHSYVRGNWRKESSTAPSLLTKSCHDMDFILWILSSPRRTSERPPHIPSSVTSAGSVKYFKKSRKPILAGSATNCVSCPAERTCQYSAKRLYHDKGLVQNDGGSRWAALLVAPEMEDCLSNNDLTGAQRMLLERLTEDYDVDITPAAKIDSRPWFGRCVYEASNDVNDEQVVTITWDDNPLPLSDAIPDREEALKGRSAKTAIFHMVAWTEKTCERRSRIYGSRGEIEADSTTIRVFDFASNQSKTYTPIQLGGGHGGGDSGLAAQFLAGIDAVKNRGWTVARAQREVIGCTLEEVIRSHAMVFCAEESRKAKRVVDWNEWWEANIASRLVNLEDGTTKNGNGYLS